MKDSSAQRRALHRPIAPTRRGLVLAVAVALILGVAIGSLGTRAPARSAGAGHHRVDIGLIDSGTTTTTTPGSPPPPAPAGYSGQLEAAYAQMYQTVTALPNGGQQDHVTAPTDFNSQVDQASPDAMAYVAQAVTPSTLTSIEAAFQDASPDAQKVAGSLAVRVVHGAHVVPSSGRRGLAAATLRHHVITYAPTALVTPHSLTVVPTTMPTDDPFAGDVSSNAFTASCPSGAPTTFDPYGETVIFILQVAIDVASGAYNAVSPWGNPGTSIASGIIAVVLAALSVAHDTLSYLQAMAGDCQQNQILQLATDADNNSFQTYQLLTQAAATANEIDQGVSNLANQDATQFNALLTLDIEQSLTGPATSVPMTSMELPSAQGGYLDSTPVGVDELVTSTIQTMQQTGQPMSPQASRDLGLAQQALGADQFKLAFDYFRLAYQAAAG